MSPTETDRPAASSPAKKAATRLVLSVIVAAFVAFWTYALFFSSKEAVNRIDDRGWAERAEGVCQVANDERIELSDYRVIVDAGDDTAALMTERAGIVDNATDIIEQMLNDVVAVSPTDEKGQAIVPLWEDEYRLYIGARRDFADELRRTGENVSFYEPEVSNLPVSERLETFAGDNEMPACAPPRDLTR